MCIICKKPFDAVGKTHLLASCRPCKDTASNSAGSCRIGDLEGAVRVRSRGRQEPRQDKAPDSALAEFRHSAPSAIASRFEAWRSLANKNTFAIAPILPYACRARGSPPLLEWRCTSCSTPQKIFHRVLLRMPFRRTASLRTFPNSVQMAEEL